MLDATTHRSSKDSVSSVLNQKPVTPSAATSLIYSIAIGLLTGAAFAYSAHFFLHGNYYMIATAGGGLLASTAISFVIFRTACVKASALTISPPQKNQASPSNQQTTTSQGEKKRTQEILKKGSSDNLQKNAANQVVTAQQIETYLSPILGNQIPEDLQTSFQKVFQKAADLENEGGDETLQMQNTLHFYELIKEIQDRPNPQQDSNELCLIQPSTELPSSDFIEALINEIKTAQNPLISPMKKEVVLEGSVNPTSINETENAKSPYEQCLAYFESKGPKVSYIAHTFLPPEGMTNFSVDKDGRFKISYNKAQVGIIDKKLKVLTGSEIAGMVTHDHYIEIYKGFCALAYSFIFIYFNECSYEHKENFSINDLREEKRDGIPPEFFEMPKVKCSWASSITKGLQQMTFPLFMDSTAWVLDIEWTKKRLPLPLNYPHHESIFSTNYKKNLENFVKESKK